jgi:penicillin-binding protein 1A
MRMLAVAQAMAARGTRGSRYAKLRWRKPAAGLFLCTTLMTATLVGIGFYRIYLDRTNLPDLEPFVRSDFPTVGHIYDTNGQPLMEMATEYRWISKYQDIPPVVCGAILAAEDKNFFSHNGVDYSSIPRVLAKLRFKSLLGRLTKLGRRDAVNSSPIFPQGGSTITQQLVRGYFLQSVTARENSNQLRYSSGFPIAVMGKTGTTNEFRDALFVGSSYGPAGITIAVRIGFDDNRSLGAGETGGRVALPVFKENRARGLYRKTSRAGAPVSS